jgi:hypothetical protein
MRPSGLYRFSRYPALLPAVALTAFAGVFVAIGYVSAAPSGSPAPPPAPVAAPAIVSGRVEAITADSITLATAEGSLTLKLAADAPTERAAAATLADLQEGDWLNATAMPHEETIFVLQGIVVIPAGLLGEAP